MNRMLSLLAICLLACYPLQTSVAATNDFTVWKCHTGGAIYSTPLVHNGVVYIGSTDSIFYAVDAKTGAELWHYRTGNPIRSTAAIEGNVVCFESGNTLYGLDLQGNVLWQDTLCSGSVTNQFDEWDYFHSSPNIVNGVAYIGTEKGRMYGINIQTGAFVFQCQTQNTGYGIRVKPAIDNGKIYFGDWIGVLFAYDLTSGQKVWQYDTYPERGWTGGPPSITTSPVVHDGSVFFAGRSCIVYSLDAATGAKQASFQDGNLWLVGGPTISDSLLFLGSSNQQVLRAFNPQTLNVVWSYSVDGRVNGTPLVDSEYVYIGTGVGPGDKIGSLYAIDKKTGTFKNRFVLNALVHSSPVIVDSILYVGCADGNIYAIDKQKFLACKHSNTTVKGLGINLGALRTDTTTSLRIRNTGDRSDSVAISCSGVTPQSAVSVAPTSAVIAAGDSLDITLTIRPSQLTAKSWNATITIVSAYNILVSAFSWRLQFTVPQASSLEGPGQAVPIAWSLSQNYPNPFNPTTVISFQLAAASDVSLKIFDVVGREVATLVNQRRPAGYHSVTWNAGSSPSGVYLYQLRAGTFVETRKLVLLK